MKMNVTIQAVFFFQHFLVYGLLEDRFQLPRSHGGPISLSFFSVHFVPKSGAEKFLSYGNAWAA